ARPAGHALNVAFTSSGLARIGLPADAFEMFSNEFVTGMTTPHRSRILGDLDGNAPERWEWGGPSGPQIDLALLLYALDDAGLQALRRRCDARARRDQRPARAGPPGGEDGRALAGRRTARTHSRRRRSGPGRRKRLRVSRARPARSTLPGRLARPAVASARLARPAAGNGRLLGDQPPPPHPPPRP